jgi:hypothetical protein
MVINIPAFEMPEKVNIHTKSSFKPFLGFSVCSLVCDLAAAVFPPLSLAA